MRLAPLALVLCAALLAAHGAAHSAPPAAKKSARKDALPARKAGLWEVVVRGDTPGPRRGQTVQQCTDAAAEAYMLMSIVPGQEDCHETRVRRRPGKAGGRYDISTVCYVHDNRVQTRMELAGDLQSAYEGRFAVEHSQAGTPNQGPMAFEGRWLGACKPGQRPGDMVLPNGVTVNVVDDVRRAQAGGRAHEGHGHKH